jgi:copper chaperone NosL
MISRRSLLVLAPLAMLGVAVAGCKKEPRCGNCGMKLDPSSPWASELTGPHPETYDTPRCALTAWRRGRADVTGLRVLDYYDRASRDGAMLVFVVGSDVLGPMGPDVIPVAPDHADRFVKDHGGKKLKLDEVTLPILEALK